MKGTIMSERDKRKLLAQFHLATSSKRLDEVADCAQRVGDYDLQRRAGKEARKAQEREEDQRNRHYAARNARLEAQLKAQHGE